MGKKIADEDMLLNIIINGNEGKSELYKLEDAMKDLNNEASKLERSIQKYESTISKNEKTINKYTSTLAKKKKELEENNRLFVEAGNKVKHYSSIYESLDATTKKSRYGQNMKKQMDEALASWHKLDPVVRSGRNEFFSLTKQVEALNRENDRCSKKLQEETVALEKNKSAANKTANDIKKLRDNLDITTLSIDELNKEITRTNILFRQTDPNTPQWRAYQQQLVALRAQHQKLQNQGRMTQGVLCRAAAGVNKYWNLAVSTIASLVSVFMGLKGAINKFVEFTDVSADVQKTTNLTKDEVKELNEEFKKLDTRSAQNELMGLARIGGKLGIEGKENLLGFARAADKINVALKEDLGGDTGESIRQVGKIVDIFKINEKFGVEQGMLKVGSVINELGMASTANEGYIVEFTKRVAGIAPIANVQVPAVMGLAATLDKFGQTSEVSSTVYSQVMTQMYKKTETYAHLAGMKLKDFANLLKNDANEAFIRVMEGLKGNNAEMEQIVANMGEMGMNGKRAVGVLGVLANNTTTLREQQALANKAFDEGISLTNEFAVKNNNEAAQLAKRRKQLNNLIVDLGEKLYPVLALSTDGFTLFVKTALSLFDFFTKYGKEVVVVTAAIIGYTVAVNASIVADKTKYLWTNNIIASLKKLYAILSVNPWGAFGLMVGAATTYLMLFVEWSGKASKAVKECETEIAKEQFEANRLFEAYSKANEGSRERVDIVKILQDKYGPYIKNLIDEKGNLTDIASAQKVVNEELSKSIALRMKEQAASDITSKYMKKYVSEMDDLRESLTEKVGKDAAGFLMKDVRGFIEGDLIPEDMVKRFDQFGLKWKEWYLDVHDAGKPFRDMNRELAELDEKFGTFISDVVSTNPVTEVQVASSFVQDTGKNDNDNVMPGRNFEIEIIRLKEEYAKKLMTKETYEAKLDALELEHLNYRLANEAKSEEEKLKLRAKIADKTISMNEKMKKAVYGLSDKEMDDIMSVLVNEVENKWTMRDEVSLRELEENRLGFQQKGEDKLTRGQEDLTRNVRRSYGLGETPEQKSAKQKTKDMSISEKYESDIALIQQFEEQGIFVHEEAERLKTEVSKKYNKERLAQVRQGVGAINSLYSAGANIFSMLKDKELAAAGDNEEKKEEIRRKYAKKEQLTAIGQAITSGSLAVMRIWEGVISGNPLVDSIIKGVLTAAQVARTAVEVSTIKSQQFAEGRYPVVGKDDGKLYKANFTDRLTTGIYDRPTLGLFSEKQPELVVDGVTTRKLVMDYPNIYRNILDVSAGRVPRFETGRYPAPVDYTTTTTSSEDLAKNFISVMEANIEMMKVLERKKLGIEWYGRGALNEMIEKDKKYQSGLNVK